MEIPVVIESVAGNGFRASAGLPLIASAEGPTRDEALAKLRSFLQERACAGEIVPLEIKSEVERPWARFAGMFKDDPLFDEWKQAIADYRRSVDKQAGVS